MIAILLAAQLAAQAPAAAPLQIAPATRLSAPPPTDCANARGMALVGDKKTAKQRQAMEKPPARRLGDLPKGRMELAVQRSVDGCVVPVYVNYDPEQRQQPVTRAGAPSNRR